MQIASQTRLPMVRSMAAPAPVATAPAPAAPMPSAPPASAQAADAFAQQFGAFTQRAQSFLSNLWDTLIGPAINGLVGMIRGLFSR